MKRILFTVIVASAVSFANAQTEQGALLVGAASNLSFSTINPEKGQSLNYSLDLQMQTGYLVADDFALGLLFGLKKQNSGYSFEPETLVSVGPFARYYFNGKFYAGAGVLLNFAEVVNIYNDSKIESSLSLLGEVGYAIWLTDKIALEPNFQYVAYLNDDATDHGLSMNLGFTLFF